MKRTIPYAFVIPTLLLLLGLGYMLLTYSKADLHMLLCSPHTAFGDWFMPWYSNTIKFIPYVVMVGLLFYKVGWSAFLAADMLLCNAIILPVKEVCFAKRPILWFSENCPDIALPLTPGVTMREVYSFPSGHASDFFLLFFCIAIICQMEYHPNHKIWKGIIEGGCFMMAAVGAYSRIYLSQHFALDVFAGIAVAVIVTGVLWGVANAKVYAKPFWEKRMKISFKKHTQS